MVLQSPTRSPHLSLRGRAFLNRNWRQRWWRR